MDPLILTAVITGIGGVVIAILTHIKHSACLGKCFEIDTYSPSEQHLKENNKNNNNIQVTDC